MRRRWIPLAVILTVPTGCDNVAWGGIDFRLEGPTEPPAVYASAAEDSVTAEPLPELPDAPVLLAGTRSGNSAHLTVVGTVEGGALQPFPSEDEIPRYREHFANTLLSPGTELVLFAEGVRVGRMTVTGLGSEQGLCVPRPAVDGVVELLPGASSVRQLLAIRDTGDALPAFAEYAPPGGIDQRAATLAVGSWAIEQSGAPWPPSLTGSRADFQGFSVADGDEPWVAATFLFGDGLAVGEPIDPNAYALFAIGQREANGWRGDYVWYRRSDGRTGKGAPRYVGHLDWNGNGQPEVLLEVFGTTTRWFAAVGRRDGVWVDTFQDPCGLRPPG